MTQCSEHIATDNDSVELIYLVLGPFQVVLLYTFFGLSVHLCTHLGEILGVELSGLEAIHIAKELQCQFVLQNVVSLACNSNTWDMVSGRLGV